MPHKFWPLAALHAITLYNHTPRQIHNWRNNHEVAFQSRLPLKDMHEFGRLAVTHVPLVRRKDTPAG
ncbi:MAG: hypothetical protein VX033_00500, partial [Verrucomicrobiota bacterium]|nr:hypothetical protein [Verrucomicrobiota bacterium]